MYKLMESIEWGEERLIACFDSEEKALRGAHYYMWNNYFNYLATMELLRKPYTLREWSGSDEKGWIRRLYIYSS